MHLHIENTAHSPLIKFENGTLLIFGRSIPEDSMLLYGPLLRFIDNYIADPLDITTTNIMLEYANSSTNRILMVLFEKLTTLHVTGKEVRVNWYFAIGDKEMYDLGNDFKDLLKIPFEIIEIEDPY